VADRCVRGSHASEREGRSHHDVDVGPSAMSMFGQVTDRNTVYDPTLWRNLLDEHHAIIRKQLATSPQYLSVPG
jgi:hypothetical protein